MSDVSNSIIISSNYNKLISLKATHGHFATSSSHINYFIDMTHLKCKRLEAKAVAEYISQAYKTSTLIDTIVCMDGTEIIGAYLADELCSPGMQSVNSRNFIFIITPEQTTAGQLFFRENFLHTIKDKKVLLLLATATTGKTLGTALSCIEYYGGSIAGIASLFSATREINGISINTVFTTDDIPGYASHSAVNCPQCQAKQPLTGMVNSHGFSKL
ncbi:MAG: orotate phosphoribosyltransferase [Lachnospiraceae bacterium]|nr:orotate phosphoribosyltransferase [Lachnospiraceae bacterium]